MDIERFIQFTAAYGNDINRWPEAVRTDARHLLGSSMQAIQSAKVEQDLDDVLSTLIDISPSATLRERVLAIPSVCNMSFVWIFRPFRPVMTIAACAVFGLLVGLSDLSSITSSDNIAQELFGPDEPEELNI